MNNHTQKQRNYRIFISLMVAFCFSAVTATLTLSFVAETQSVDSDILMCPLTEPLLPPWGGNTCDLISPSVEINNVMKSFPIQEIPTDSVLVVYNETPFCEWWDSNDVPSLKTSTTAMVLYTEPIWGTIATTTMTTSSTTTTTSTTALATGFTTTVDNALTEGPCPLSENESRKQTTILDLATTNYFMFNNRKTGVFPYSDDEFEHSDQDDPMCYWEDVKSLVPCSFDEDQRTYQSTKWLEKIKTLYQLKMKKVTYPEKRVNLNDAADNFTETIGSSNTLEWWWMAPIFLVVTWWCSRTVAKDFFVDEIFSKEKVEPHNSSMKKGGCGAVGKVAGMTPEAQKEFEKIMAMSGVQMLRGIFEEHGKELRLVGGVVRDLLRGITPNDIDMATTATPQTMLDFLKEKGIRVVEKGIQHGTIIAVIDKVEYEITTLRIDTDQDGRHCDVEFTEDWHVDATRRDFSINAMSMGMDGVLYDFYEGKAHLAAKRIAFVGNGTARMEEDFLRILRYFRFHGRLHTEVADPTSNPMGDHNAETLAAIAKCAHGLDGISGERIRSEMSKLLVGPTGQRLLRVMCETKVMEHCRLPVPPEKEAEFVRVAQFSTKFMTRLMALVDTGKEWEGVKTRWKLSSPEMKLGEYILVHRTVPHSLEEYEELLTAVKTGSGKPLQEAERTNVVELALYQGQPGHAATLREWDVPVFPVSGRDLKGRMPSGPGMGAALAEMKASWTTSRFTLTKEALLDAHFTSG